MNEISDLAKNIEMADELFERMRHLPIIKKITDNHPKPKQHTKKAASKRHKRNKNKKTHRR